MYRRSDDILENECLCGSSKLTKYCCARPEGIIFKRPILLKEPEYHAEGSNKKCLFSYRRSCSPKITREHYISQSVLRLLNNVGLKNLKVSGLRASSEFKSIAIRNLTAKILCKTHNSMFSRLDGEIARFAKAIQSHFEFGEDKEYLFCGHDIERWLFKVAMGMYFGKIFDAPFDDRFLRSRSFLDCMIVPVAGNKVGGRYVAKLGEYIELDYVEFSVQSWNLKRTGNFCGITFCFFGIPLTLFFHGDKSIERGAKILNSQFRPHVLILNGHHKTTRIWLSWHGTTMGPGVEIGHKASKK